MFIDLAKEWKVDYAFVLKIQCFLLVILWFIWPLPHTTALRYICLVFGSILGLFQIYSSWSEVSLKKSWPSLLLTYLFFSWVSIHVFYIANDPVLQYREYTTVWRNAGLSFLFGLGLIVGIGRWPLKNLMKYLVVGLSASVVFYFVKFCSSNYLIHYISVPEYLLLFKGSAPFYVPKISYVFFLTPILVTCLVTILFSKKQISDEGNSSENFYFIFGMIGCTAIYTIFILENIKNGIFYSVLLTCMFLFVELLKSKNYSSKAMRVPVVILSIALLFLCINIKQNQSWQNFFIDFKVAMHIDKNDAWLYKDAPLPLNESGKAVSGTNFDRVSWGIVGLQLLKENPLGYGVLQSSFGHLAEKKWPGSGLAQSHSGWLDLALGLGIPGIVLLFLSFIFGLKECLIAPDAFEISIFWIGIGCILIFITTEVAQKIYIEALFLILGSICGVGMLKSRSLN